MPSPFPGMDPYLEAPQLWEDFHQNLAIQIQHQLSPLMRPRYVARVERTVSYDEITLSQPRTIRPDVSVFEARERKLRESSTLIAPAPFVAETKVQVEVGQWAIEIRTVDENYLVTAIEILSPVNKRRGHDAFDEYRRKRQAFLRSQANFVEIDLIRAGERWAFEVELPRAPYFIFLSRATNRARVEIWPLRLQEPIPVVPIPLREPEPDVPLDLGKAIQEIYDATSYDLTINYEMPPPKPDLNPEDAQFVEQLLRDKKLRE